MSLMQGGDDILLGRPIKSGDGSVRPAWQIVLGRDPGPCIADTPSLRSGDLERIELDDVVVQGHVDDLVSALDLRYRQFASTPSGVSWLDVHRVPVLRLVRQAVRKILALSSWPPFQGMPVFGCPATLAAAVGDRAASTREYRYFTVTWPGVAYLLGATLGDDEAEVPMNDVGPEPPRLKVRQRLPALGVLRGVRSDFAVVSWSGRHVETLQPVLEGLARRSARVVVLDFATHETDAFGDLGHERVAVIRLADVLGVGGGLPRLTDKADGGAVVVGRAQLVLDRLLWVLGRVLGQSAGSTQPSWAATCELDALLSQVIEQIEPHALICCNDTSPIGHLAVRLAKAREVDTVYLQHGAWIPGEVTWPALHCHHLVVMGERDRPLAETWATDPDVTVHVLGQPRFDTWISVSREDQRGRLRAGLSSAGLQAERIAVLALQPFSPIRLKQMLDVAAEALGLAEQRWAVVVAPHPSQDTALVQQLVGDRVKENADDAPPAMVVKADGSGASDCLAGADALLTVYSTCGIEALLVDVPVLELGLGGARTLGLADHGAAFRCETPAEVARALDRAAGAEALPAEAKEAICRGDGAAGRAADLLTAILSASKPAGDKGVPNS